MTCAAVRSWLRQQNRPIPDGFVIDHLICGTYGGADHPFNYFVMPAEDNRGFWKWIEKAKAKYVGPKVWNCANDFAQYVKREGKAVIDFNAFDQQLIYESCLK